MIIEMEQQFRQDGAYRLADLCQTYLSLDRDVYNNHPIMPYYNEYRSISERLYREELDNLGLSKEAHELRKEWRRLIRKMTKEMRLWIRNAKSYDREWSKPRTQYIFYETGEIHNGLYYTIKAWFDMRKYTKMPLKPMKLSTYNRRYK